MTNEETRASLLLALAGLKAATDSLQTLADALAPAPVPDPVPEPEEPQEPAPPVEPGVGIAAVADLAPGQWMQFGKPWRALEETGAFDKARDNGGKDFDGVLGAWNGAAWDDSGPWLWAAGGHDDSLFNGAIRYDLAGGRPVMAMPHLSLNVEYMREGAWYEPYAADADGNQIRPRSSHTYNNTVLHDDGWLYLITGHIYQSGKGDAQVWRCRPEDPKGTMERLPDRVDANGRQIGGYNVNLLSVPGHGLMMFDESRLWRCDLVAGVYEQVPQQGGYWANRGGVAWDAERGGVWAVSLPNKGPCLSFTRPDEDGVWRTEVVVTDERITGAALGNPGIAVVPGFGVLVKGAGPGMLRYDPEAQELTELPAPDGHSSIFSKFTYHAPSGCCLLVQSVDEGVWAYRPGVATLQEEEEPDPEEEEEPDDPAPDLGVAFSTFADHYAAPGPWTPAAWDQPIARQPEAPDYDALAPGAWAELHYDTEEAVANSRFHVKDLVSAGTPNARVYLHPKADGTPYQAGIDLRFAAACEVVGVPANGKRPLLRGGVAPGSVGVIARGFDLDGGHVGWSGVRARNEYIKWIVQHDLRVTGSFRNPWGVSDPAAPLTYMEFAGCVFGPDPGWHVIYLERSIGKLVVLSSAFFGSGNSGHAFKNLAHQSRIEDSVFSNVGLDGRPVAQDGKGRDIIGLMPLDLYLPTETTFRRNTVIFRTGDSVRQCMAYRGRAAWGNNDKGRRLPDDTWELWSPDSPEYHDPAKWAEIAAALPAFDQGLEAARAEPWLLTHDNRDNTFIVVNAHGGSDDARAASMESLRPIADNHQRNDLVAEAQALAAKHDNDETAWLVEASPALRYAWDHTEPTHQAAMVKIGKLPRSVPIQHPEGWRERAGLFWGPQKFITCNADLSEQAVTGERPVDATPRPHDALEIEQPPRLMTEE